MVQRAGFYPAGVVTSDGEGSITFGETGVAKNTEYAVSVAGDGTVLLSPTVDIPAREQLAWQNSPLRDSVHRGLAQSASGDVVDLGDFAEFAGVN